MVSSGLLGVSNIPQFIYALITSCAVCVRWSFKFSRLCRVLSVGVDVDVGVNIVYRLFWLGMASH